MGQPGAASVIWHGQNKCFSPALSEAVGQPTLPAGVTYTARQNEPKILKAIPPRLVAFLRKTEGSHSGLAFCGTPVIPFQTLTGKPITDNGKPFARIRLYDATEAQKYHQRSGSGTHIYIPHGLLRGATLILTEGEFKAASLAEAGFCAVGLCGMSGAMRNTDGEPKLHDELVNVLEFRQPAKVLFLGDSDAVLNSDFSREAAKLRKTLFAS